MRLTIDTVGKEPIYKQLVSKIEMLARSGRISPGEMLPSMNELADELGISRETAKKAYGILTEHAIIEPRQGKGFYVCDLSKNPLPKVMVLFDKLSVYKQLLYNSFLETLGKKAEVAILTHNQNVNLLEYYLDQNLDRFDYYVVTPHFPLDSDTQASVKRQMARIPNRKLIMMDRLLPDYPGNYSAVYQDFESDIYDGLSQGFSKDEGDNVRLKVITLPESLYGAMIRSGVERFCTDYHIPVSYYSSAPDNISAGDTFLVLNSQLDEGLVGLARKIKSKGLVIGKDVKIISYNEFAMNELVLDGLTTVSTDFPEMGRIAAALILDKRIAKIHCPFRMTRRKTF